MRTYRANLTLTKEGKESLEKAAASRGMSLSMWVEDMARKEAKKLKPETKAS